MRAANESLLWVKFAVCSTRRSDNAARTAPICENAVERFLTPLEPKRLWRDTPCVDGEDHVPARRRERHVVGHAYGERVIVTFLDGQGDGKLVEVRRVGCRSRSHEPYGADPPSAPAAQSDAVVAFDCPLPVEREVRPFAVAEVGRGVDLDAPVRNGRDGCPPCRRRGGRSRRRRRGRWAGAGPRLKAFPPVEVELPWGRSASFRRGPGARRTGSGRQRRRAASTCCGTPTPRSCWRRGSPW